MFDLLAINFKALAKKLNLFWQIYYAIGQIYFVVNGQILKK